MTTVENLKPTIWVLALDYILWSRAIIQTLSLRNSLWRRLHLINSVDNTKFPWNAPSMDGTHQFLQKLTLPYHPPSPGYSPHHPSFLHVMSIISFPTPSKETFFGKMFLVCLPSQAREWPVDCPELINLYFWAQPDKAKSDILLNHWKLLLTTWMKMKKKSNLQIFYAQTSIVIAHYFNLA